MSVTSLPQSNGAGHFFEGVEKLLEIWFTKSANSCGSGDARDVTRSRWESILDHVHCKVIDAIEEHGHMAYLLSESSLFVSKERVILKTCGTTMCLQALPYILSAMKEECGLDVVADCFYSRKNFMKPDHQPHPHKTFHDEILYINDVMSNRSQKKESKKKNFSQTANTDSASYCLGRMDGDCWFLYTLNHAGNSSLIGVKDPDQTLEILMTGLDKDVMSKFTLFDENGKKRHSDTTTEMTGISDIIPGSSINASLFDPCGYSMNALLPENQYWTIHITPEEEFSYVSFETNFRTSDYSTIISNVVNLFKPCRFTMTLFANNGAPLKIDDWNRIHGPNVKGFKHLDKQIARLQDYSLFYTNYIKHEN